MSMDKLEILYGFKGVPSPGQPFVIAWATSSSLLLILMASEVSPEAFEVGEISIVKDVNSRRATNSITNVFDLNSTPSLHDRN